MEWNRKIRINEKESFVFEELKNKNIRINYFFKNGNEEWLIKNNDELSKYVQKYGLEKKKISSFLDRLKIIYKENIFDIDVLEEWKKELEEEFGE